MRLSFLEEYNLLFDKFLKGKSRSTVRCYWNDWKKYLEFTQYKQWSDLEFDQRFFERFRLYLLEQELSEYSVYRALSTIKSFFSYLHSIGFIAFEEVTVVEPRPSLRKRDLLDHESLTDYTYGLTCKDHVETSEALILIFTIEYGLKRSEIAKISVDDFNIYNDSIFLKTRKRTLLLSEDTSLILYQHIEFFEKELKLINGGEILIQRGQRYRDKPIDGSTIYRIIRKNMDSKYKQKRKTSPEKLRFNSIVRGTRENMSNKEIFNYFRYHRKQLIYNIRKQGLDKNI